MDRYVGTACGGGYAPGSSSLALYCKVRPYVETRNVQALDLRITKSLNAHDVPDRRGRGNSSNVPRDLSGAAWFVIGHAMTIEGGCRTRRNLEEGNDAWIAAK
jgi:hypothetical protein